MRDLSQFLNKKVKLFLKDGYVKVGKFIGFDKDFIFLLYENNKDASISISEVREIQEVGK